MNKKTAAGKPAVFFMLLACTRNGKAFRVQQTTRYAGEFPNLQKKYFVLSCEKFEC